MHIAHATAVGDTKCLLLFLYRQKTKPKRVFSQRKIEIHFFFFSKNIIPTWCPGRDLNSYTVRQRLLRPSCLPIPPPGRKYYSLFMVGREGFEPTKAKPKDLQSSPFDHSGTDPYKKKLRILDFSILFFTKNPIFQTLKLQKMEPPIRLELMTAGLQNRCSTNWAMVALGQIV